MGDRSGIGAAASEGLEIGIGGDSLTVRLCGHGKFVSDIIIPLFKTEV